MKTYKLIKYCHVSKEGKGYECTGVFESDEHFEDFRKSTIRLKLFVREGITDIEPTSSKDITEEEYHEYIKNLREGKRDEKD